jgi:putative Holliday junction resolvase
VVGLPKQTNGLDSENLPRVQAFVKRLETAFPDIPVEWWDERYTSVMAHQAMLESGIGRKARQNKALVDEISATIILQGWMERRRF